MGGDGNDKDLIICQGCGKRYKWKLELAGRRLKCGCGAAIDVPERVAVLEGVYDLFEGEAQEAPPLIKPAVDDDAPAPGRPKPALRIDFWTLDPYDPIGLTDGCPAGPSPPEISITHPDCRLFGGSGRDFDTQAGRCGTDFRGVSARV